jgi:hypothetical protein
MSDQTTRLQLPFLAAGQAQKHVIVNESLLRLDALVQLAAMSASAASQLALPTDGDIYILSAGKSGADWGARANGALAYYRDGVWEEIAPREGWLAHAADGDRSYVYSGAAWVELGAALGAWRILGRPDGRGDADRDEGGDRVRQHLYPAGAMGPNGIVRATAEWSYTNGANNKTLAHPPGQRSLGHGVGSDCSDGKSIPAPPMRQSKIAMQTTLKWRRVWLVWRTSAHRRARWANAGKTITLESYIVELAYGP